MSVQALSWVLGSSQACGSPRHVLVSIANHAGARGENAWPSLETLAAESHTSRRTVLRSIAVLEEMGELLVYEHAGKRGLGGTTNRYEMPGVPGWTAPPDCGAARKRCQPDTTSDTERGANLTPLQTTERGANLTPLQTTERGDTVTPLEPERGVRLAPEKSLTDKSLKPPPPTPSNDTSEVAFGRPEEEEAPPSKNDSDEAHRRGATEDLEREQRRAAAGKRPPIVDPAAWAERAFQRRKAGTNPPPPPPDPMEMTAAAQAQTLARNDAEFERRRAEAAPIVDPRSVDWRSNIGRPKKAG